MRAAVSASVALSVSYIVISDASGDDCSGTDSFLVTVTGVASNFFLCAFDGAVDCGAGAVGAGDAFEALACGARAECLISVSSVSSSSSRENGKAPSAVDGGADMMDVPFVALPHTSRMIKRARQPKFGR